VGEDIDGLVVEVEEGMHAAPHALHGPVAGEDVGVELQVPGHVVPLEKPPFLLLVVHFGRYLLMLGAERKKRRPRIKRLGTPDWLPNRSARAGRCEGDGGARLTQTQSGDACAPPGVACATGLRAPPREHHK